MPDLTFVIEAATVAPFAAVPTIAFRLQVENRFADETVHTVVLRSQIQIEAARRHYGPDEQALLMDLFGEPERWSRTLRTMLWTHISLVVPAFTGRTAVDLHVPCTFDFNVAATKYFHGLADGGVPLSFLFSGTVFYASSETGALQVSLISWEKEARFLLPVQVWRQMMDHYYPNGAWLRLRRDAFDRLYRYKVRLGIPTWEEAVDRLVPDVQDVVPS